MISLKHTCEVFVLRNDLPIREWTECKEGRELEEKKQIFQNSKVEENRCCGDLSRVMASFDTNFKATECILFGKYVAMCGECALVELFFRQTLHPSIHFMAEPILQCIEGSSISGDLECLETCAQTWITYAVTKSDSCYGRFRLMTTMCNDLLKVCALEQIDRYTFEWISSRWSTDSILAFIERVPIHHLLYRHDKMIAICCGSSYASNASLLMSCFGFVGSLNGFQWMSGMGVKSESAVTNCVLGGRREVIEHLLHTHDIAVCDLSAKLILSHCNLSTLKWCLSRSLFSCSDALIHECISRKYHVQLQVLLESGGVATQTHIEAAASRLSFACLRVLFRSCERWNPSSCITVMQTERKWHITHMIQCWKSVMSSLSRSFELACLIDKRAEEHRVLWLVYDWCKLGDVPIRRWSSQSTLQQIIYKGDVDRDGVICGRTTNSKVACRGNQLHSECKCAPIGNCATEGNPLRAWMCNLNAVCSCRPKIGRRHSII